MYINKRFCEVETSIYADNFAIPSMEKGLMIFRQNSEIPTILVLHKLTKPGPPTSAATNMSL